MEELIRNFGYLGIFIGTFLEGETFVIIAGLMAHQGLLNPVGVVAAAFAGSFCGDQTWFYIGRMGGPWVMRRLEQAKPLVDRASDLLRRWDVWFILCFRYIYGIRNVAPFAMGNAGVPPLRFLGLNMIAALVWAVSYGGSGYVFGSALSHALGDVQHYEYFTLGFLIAILTIVWASFKIAAWRRRRQMAKPPVGAETPRA